MSLNQDQDSNPQKMKTENDILNKNEDYDPRLNPEAPEFVFQGYIYSSSENLAKYKIISALKSFSFDKRDDSDASEFNDELHFRNSFISYDVEYHKFVIIKRAYTSHRTPE